MDSTLKVETEHGIAEIYTNRIYEIFDSYVANLDEPESIRESTVFSGLIQEIYLQIFKPTKKNTEEYNKATYQNVRQNSILPYSDIQTLDALFDVYCAVCFKARQVPTLLEFGYMTGLSKETIHDWIAGNTRNGKDDLHRRTAKRWKSVCEMALEKRAVISNSIGSICALKAGHQWREAAPITPTESDMLPVHESAAEISARYAAAALPERPDLSEFD